LIVNQLNPHFINNALQLVQVRVYNDQESVRVIDKLARNIHLIFQNSRDKKPFYSLAEEMVLVRNYLYIQHQRFGSNLCYALPEEDELHEIGWVQVPLMQIQIHVENAIEHGIRNQPDGQGRVTVAIADAGPVLNITVEDSGVGRARAHQLGSRGNHQGTRMLAELHVIFNRYNPLPIRSYYEDDIFRNDAGEAYGTRVHLSIPKSYRYDLD
jgi:sensor histidine kinase YesM